MSDVQPLSPTSGKTEARVPVELHVPADLTMYAALVGCQPRIDPMLADPLVKASEARRENPWSPVLLSIYIRQVYRAKGISGLAPAGIKVNKPELTAWLRKQSNTARRRFAENT